MTTGDTILPSQHNPPLTDIASSITNSLSRQGYGGMLAALDMGGYKITNAAAGTVGTDLARLDQVISSVGGAISGNLTIGGTLGVTGAAIFNGNATVASQLNIATYALFQHNGTDGFLRTVTGKLYLGAGGNNHLSIDGTTGDVALLAAENFQFNSGNLQWSSLANFSIGPNAGVPLLAWDSGDYISYDRSLNTMYFSIGNASKLILTASGAFDGNAVELGYKDCPQNAQSGAYTLVLADRGKDLYLTSSGAVTIPPNSSVAFPLGTTIAFTNDGSARTLTQGAGVTIKFGGSGASGNRTLGAGSMGAIKKVATDTWYVSGAGVS